LDAIANKAVAVQAIANAKDGLQMPSDRSSESRDPITVTTKEACRISGLGPTTLWKLRKAGRLKTAPVPGLDRTLILYSSLQELLKPSASTLQPKRGRGRPRKVTAQPEATPGAAQ
jgi:hypothetical protein